MIDTHSHILPGIDDGSETFESSINILLGLQSQGFTDVILTPHYVVDSIYQSPRSENLKLLAELKKVAPEGINLYLGNELYVDHSLLEKLKKHEISSMADSKYLLVELPMNNEFRGYEDVFENLQYAGYKVILAHPERYHLAHEDFEFLERIHQSGVLFQCNYGSFIGQYGKKSLKTAKKLAKKHLIFTLGTDIHRERDYTEVEQALKKLRKYYSREELKALTTENPGLMLNK